MEKTIKISSQFLSVINEALQKLNINESVKHFTPVIVEANGKFTSVIKTEEDFDPSILGANIDSEEEKEEETTQSKETREQLLNKAKEAIKQSIETSNDLQSILKKMKELSQTDDGEWKLNKQQNTAVLQAKNARIFKQNDYLCLSHDGKIELFKSVPELRQWLKDHHYPLPDDKIIIHESTITETEKDKKEYRNWIDLLDQFKEKDKQIHQDELEKSSKTIDDNEYEANQKVIDNFEEIQKQAIAGKNPLVTKIEELNKAYIKSNFNPDAKKKLMAAKQELEDYCNNNPIYQKYLTFLGKDGFIKGKVADAYSANHAHNQAVIKQNHDDTIGLGKRIPDEVYKADMHKKEEPKISDKYLRQDEEVEECFGGVGTSTASLGSAVQYLGNKKKKSVNESVVKEDIIKNQDIGIFKDGKFIPLFHAGKDGYLSSLKNKLNKKDKKEENEDDELEEAFPSFNPEKPDKTYSQIGKAATDFVDTVRRDPDLLQRIKDGKTPPLPYKKENFWKALQYSFHTYSIPNQGTAAWNKIVNGVLNETILNLLKQFQDQTLKDKNVTNAISEIIKTVYSEKGKDESTETILVYLKDFLNRMFISNDPSFKKFNTKLAERLNIALNNALANRGVEEENFIEIKPGDVLLYNITTDVNSDIDSANFSKETRRFDKYKDSNHSTKKEWMQKYFNAQRQYYIDKVYDPLYDALFSKESKAKFADTQVKDKYLGNKDPEPSFVFYKKPTKNGKRKDIEPEEDKLTNKELKFLQKNGIDVTKFDTPRLRKLLNAFSESKLFESTEKYPWLKKIIGKRLVEDDSPADFATGSPISSDMDSSSLSTDTTSGSTSETNTISPDFSTDYSAETPGDFGDIDINVNGNFDPENNDEEIPAPNTPEFKIIDVLANVDNPNDIKVKVENQKTKEIEIKDISEI